jgi:uncharacterized protein YdiU (UPF0061 family)
MPFDNLNFISPFYNLGDTFYSEVSPSPLRDPFWIHHNQLLADELGISPLDWNTDKALDIFSGNNTFKGQPSIAMVYAGHQFGGYSPQLGDGRALLLGQVETEAGIVDIQLKGSGKTPYSRFGDGRAVLRSSIREYLAGEAMHHLHIPSTRALCLIGSKEPVQREQIETGAVIARVAKTHIRFGHFEYFYYTDQHDNLKKLADYVIEHFLPEAKGKDEQYQQLFQYTVTATAKLIAQWQSVGFAHGVMNTDNMSIIGETIDYGPYAFLDDYEPGFICNHSDHSGRYAFNQQPLIGLWNLNALAHALSPLIDVASIKTILSTYEPTFLDHFENNMRRKLGLQRSFPNDEKLRKTLLSLLANSKVDYTLFFRRLCDFGNGETAQSLSELFDKDQTRFIGWCEDYKQRLQQETISLEERHAFMKSVNPKFIARNYLMQRAIEQAEDQSDYTLISSLFTVLQSPFNEHISLEELAEAPPESGKHLPISCSS